MKKALSLLLFSISTLGFSATQNEKEFLEFYAKANPRLQRAYLKEVVQDTEKWMKRVNLNGQVDTFLSMGHRESGFDMFADDAAIVGLKKHSVGIFQTRADYSSWLREYWRLRGYTLGPNDAVDTQVAFGVAEFRVHINRAGGNIWGGVRRYNGSGPKAREYTRKVMISRRVIFKRPHFEGESVPVWDGLSRVTRNKKKEKK